MGLFWKRTKPHEDEPPAEPQSSQSPETEAPPQAAPEQKGGFFQRFLSKLEGTEPAPEVQQAQPPELPVIEPIRTPEEPPSVRAPEQEKKSFWEKWGWGQAEEAGIPLEQPAAETARSRFQQEDIEKQTVFQRWKASLNRTSENLMSRIE